MTSLRPTMKRLLGGMETLKFSPSLTMSKARLRTMGNRPTMRSREGLRTRT